MCGVYKAWRIYVLGCIAWWMSATLILSHSLPRVKWSWRYISKRKACYHVNLTCLLLGPLMLVTLAMMGEEFLFPWIPSQYCNLQWWIDFTCVQHTCVQHTCMQHTCIHAVCMMWFNVVQKPGSEIHFSGDIVLERYTSNVLIYRHGVTVVVVQWLAQDLFCCHIQARKGPGHGLLSMYPV